MLAVVLRVQLDTTAIAAWGRRARTNLDAAMRAAMRAAAELVAEEARTRHTFTNRTGKLERNIKARAPTGSFSRGTLSVLVVADTDYAKFLEEKTYKRVWAYLAPAYTRSQARIKRMIADVFTRAVRGRGGR